MSETRFEKALGFNLKAFEDKTLIYALCDFETLKKKSISLENFILICKKNDVKLIQYRDKISSFDIQKQNLIYIKKEISVPLIINDKIELVEYADGIHLGQEDLAKIHSSKIVALKLLRKIIKDKLLGISTHDELEILEANELDLDMIGLGAYRNTNTKDISTILGDNISYLAKMSSHPVCAIGGVKVNDKIQNISFNVVGSDLYEN